MVRSHLIGALCVGTVLLGFAFAWFFRPDETPTGFGIHVRATVETDSEVDVPDVPLDYGSRTETPRDGEAVPIHDSASASTPPYVSVLSSEIIGRLQSVAAVHEYSRIMTFVPGPPTKEVGERIAAVVWMTKRRYLDEQARIQSQLASDLPIPVEFLDRMRSAREAYWEERLRLLAPFVPSTEAGRMRLQLYGD